MFHKTQYLVGEAHTKRVGPALVAKSTWREDEHGECPAFEIKHALEVCIYLAGAVLVSGPTRTAPEWLDSLETFSGMSSVDLSDIALVSRVDEPDLSWRCIKLDEVGTRTRALLVNGWKPVTLDVEQHTPAAHDALADQPLTPTIDGWFSISDCQIELSDLTRLGVFLR